jgi:hypothetical protein
MDFNMRFMRKKVQGATRSANGDRRDFAALQQHAERASGQHAPPAPKPTNKRSASGGGGYNPAFRRRKKKQKGAPRSKS